MTPRQLLKETTRLFEKAGVPDPETDADLLLSHLTGRQTLALRLDDETELPEETLTAYLKLRDRRMTRVPLQYLTGSQFFLAHEYLVDSRVLIPRPETALLAERAITLAGERQGTRVLDLCCGSGCIGLEVALAVPFAAVDLADLSEDALNVAKRNAERLHAKVSFFCGDLFHAVAGRKYDLILSNPPYIPDAECACLQEEVMAEPAMALKGGADGLDFYRRIAGEASDHLNEAGKILLETGWNQAGDVSELLRSKGFQTIRIHQDLQHIDRIVEAGR